MFSLAHTLFIGLLLNTLVFQDSQILTSNGIWLSSESKSTHLHPLALFCIMTPSSLFGECYVSLRSTRSVALDEVEYKCSLLPLTGTLSLY